MDVSTKMVSYRADDVERVEDVLRRRGNAEGRSDDGWVGLFVLFDFDSSHDDPRLSKSPTRTRQRAEANPSGDTTMIQSV